jgi:hypothetical protein
MKKKQKPLDLIASIIEESLRDLPKGERLAKLKAANAEASRVISSYDHSPSDRTERSRRDASLHP